MIRLKFPEWAGIILLSALGHFTESKQAPSFQSGIQQDSLPSGAFLCDTTKIFHSAIEVLREMRSKDSALKSWFNNKPNSRDRQFIYDSLGSVLQDDCAVCLYNVLLREKKDRLSLSTMQFMMKLSSNVEKIRLQSLFLQYPKALREGPLGKQIENVIYHLAENEGHNIGNALASASMETKEGKKTVLGPILNGRPVYILVFGASWCRPCKYQDRVLHQAAVNWDSSRYKILHLSFDTDKEKWLAAEHLSGYERTSYRIIGSFQAHLAKTLNIKGVPRYIVIDDQAQVILDVNNIRMLFKKLTI